MFRLSIIALLAIALSTEVPAAAKSYPPLTQAQCAQIRAAIATYGMSAVLLAARLRGYTAEELAYARRACRI